jgi:hypothetical protein
VTHAPLLRHLGVLSVLQAARHVRLAGACSGCGRGGGEGHGWTAYRSAGGTGHEVRLPVPVEGEMKGRVRGDEYWHRLQHFHLMPCSTHVWDTSAQETLYRTQLFRGLGAVANPNEGFHPYLPGGAQQQAGPHTGCTCCQRPRQMGGRLSLHPHHLRLHGLLLFEQCEKCERPGVS